MSFRRNWQLNWQGAVTLPVFLIQNLHLHPSILIHYSLSTPLAISPSWSGKHSNLDSMEKARLLVTLFLISLVTHLTAGLTFSLSENELKILKIKISEARGEPNQDELSETEQNEPIPRQNASNIYAVLVAGSAGYQNYRHQVNLNQKRLRRRRIKILEKSQVQTIKSENGFSQG